MYVRVYVCVYARVCVCTYVCLYVYVCVRACVYVCVRTYVCVYMFVRVFVYVYVCVREGAWVGGMASGRAVRSRTSGGGAVSLVARTLSRGRRGTWTRDTPGRS